MTVRQHSNETLCCLKYATQPACVCALVISLDPQPLALTQAWLHSQTKLCPNHEKTQRRNPYVTSLTNKALKLKLN